MPQKHVRFAKSNIAYGPPQTHSLSYTELSPLSSGGPITPPQLHLPPLSHAYSHHPQLFKSLRPHRPPVPVRLSSALAYGPKPLIVYDISLSPRHIRGHFVNTHAMLAEPATQPPLPHLTLIAPHHIRWAISVSPMGPTPFVTISDVFAAIHHSLRQHVGEHEYRSHRAPSRVRASFEARCHRHHDPRARSEEKMGGLRRIDFFLGQNRFLGLSASTDGPHVWVLHVK